MDPGDFIPALKACKELRDSDGKLVGYILPPEDYKRLLEYLELGLELTLQSLYGYREDEPPVEPGDQPQS